MEYRIERNPDWYVLRNIVLNAYDNIEKANRWLPTKNKSDFYSPMEIGSDKATSSSYSLDKFIEFMRSFWLVYYTWKVGSLRVNTQNACNDPK